MAKQTNRMYLKQIMKANEMTRPMVAEACCVGLSTVDRWLAPPSKKSHRKMPDMAVKLLSYMDKCGDLEIDLVTYN